jgi:hypothetical protein
MAFGFGNGFGFGLATGRTPAITPVTWSGQLTNITVGVNGLSLTSNGGALSWNQRNVYSQQVTTGGEGMARFHMTGLIPDCDSIFGLAKMSKTANNYTDIDHAFYRIPNNGSINIVENGAFITSVVTDSPYLRYTIEIIGGEVKYYYNNELVYTSLVVPSGEYKMKCSLYNPNAANGKVEMISF